MSEAEDGLYESVRRTSRHLRPTIPALAPTAAERMGDIALRLVIVGSGILLFAALVTLISGCSTPPSSVRVALAGNAQYAREARDELTPVLLDPASIAAIPTATRLMWADDLAANAERALALDLWANQEESIMAREERAAREGGD